MKTFTSLLAIATSIGFANGVMAQDASAVTPADDGAAGLTEILVTAQKRAENLQDVPIAVSAITADALANKGVGGVLQLQQAIPNLTISNAQGVVNTSIRGIGTNAIAPGFENSVAFFLDGVYIASQAGGALNLSNIAQVAVLKGPQGTLFGRNATGGVLQITTRDPGAEPVVEGTLSYGNFETVSGTAYMGGEVVPNLNADFAFYGTGMGKGWGNSRTTGYDLYRTKHDIALRSKWVWTPGETTKVTLIGDYSDRKSNPNTVVTVPGTISGYDPASGAQPDLGYDTKTDIKNYVNFWSAGGSMSIDQEIGALSLTSITAYRQSENKQYFDFDGLTVLPADYGSYTWPDKQFSQEVQLQSPATGRFRWTVGAYYFSGKTAYDPLELFVDSQGVAIDITARLKTRSIAGFAQGTYELAPGTNLTLGARYTKEKRTLYDASQTVTTTSNFAVLVPFLPLPAGVVLSQNEYSGHLKFNKFTFRASLDHRFSDQVLGYASFNRGFKSGSYNLSVPDADPYQPETLDSYEVGLKTDLLDRRLRLNVAAFLNKFDNVQSQLLSAQNVIYIANAAKATTYGLDLDLTAQITPELHLTGGLGLLSAKYDSYPNSPLSTPQGGQGPVATGSAKGNRLPLAAPVTASLGVTYTIPMTSGELTFTPNIYYNSGQYFESDNVIKQKAYSLINATAKWESADKHYSVALYGRNLTNKRIYTFVATTANDTHLANLGEPRAYGVTLGFKY